MILLVNSLRKHEVVFQLGIHGCGDQFEISLVVTCLLGGAGRVGNAVQQ